MTDLSGRVSLVLAFFLCSLATTTAAAADLLLAINKGDNTVAIIDAATLKVLGTAPTGPDPHEVVASADGKLAYITNYFAGNGVANSISVVDLVAMKALPPLISARLAVLTALHSPVERSTSRQRVRRSSPATIPPREELTG